MNQEYIDEFWSEYTQNYNRNAFAIGKGEFVELLTKAIQDTKAAIAQELKEQGSISCGKYELCYLLYSEIDNLIDQTVVKGGRDENS